MGHTKQKDYRGKDQQDTNTKYYRGKKIFHIHNLTIINIRLMSILKYDNIIFVTLQIRRNLEIDRPIQQYFVNFKNKKVFRFSLFSYFHDNRY